MDRHVLIDVVKDVAPMQVGGFIYPFSEFATPKPELFKRVGYQTDPTAAEKEAKALMAAAGYKDGIKGLDFLVRDVASFKLWSQAMQAMLQQTLNVQCNLRVVVESVWFDDIANGHFDLAIGAVVSTLLDPSDYFNAWYRSGGPQNYSFWSNAKFDALADQIDREVDPAKRQALIRQAEAIFEQDPPVLPVAWEQIIDIWYNNVKGVQSVRILRRLRRRPPRYVLAGQEPERYATKPTGKATTRMNSRRTPATGDGPAADFSGAAPRRWRRPMGCGRAAHAGGDPQPVRRLEIPARRAGAEPEARRRAARRHPEPPAAFRLAAVRAPSAISAPRAACSTT